MAIPGYTGIPPPTDYLDLRGEHKEKLQALLEDLDLTMPSPR